MDSKTRALLRGKANKLEPSVIIGIGGITENVINQISINLDAHELDKLSVLKNDLYYNKNINEMNSKLNAEPICAIGKKLVLYRYSFKKKVKHILEN